MHLVELSVREYRSVCSLFWLAIAAMLASFVFFVVARHHLSPSHRPAMVLSSLIVLIAGCHYVGILHSWDESFRLDAGVYKPTGVPFHDAYRYVDWLLTVPLLCVALVSVLNLRAGVRGPMMARLIVAAVLMIGLGYPGEVASALSARALWGAASTVPFLYILHILWVEISRAARDESAHVKVLLRNTRLLLLATWGFYPIVFLLPLLGVGGRGLVGAQAGYSLADIGAKCGYGIMLYALARARMQAPGESATGVPPTASVA